MINVLRKVKEKIGNQKKVYEYTDQDPNLKSLSPRKDMDITHYKSFLDDMFRLEDVFNVGVTGPYGSGKSSTIESYETQNQDKKFIHISLGKYDTDHDNEKKEPSKQELRRSTKEIEGKIINQLLHQVGTKQVPQAFAKVKKNNSNDTIKKWSFFVPIVLVLLTYVTMYNYWVDFVNAHELFSSESVIINPVTRVLAGFILLVFVGLLTYKFGEAQINRTIIRKISIRGSEIELYKDDKKSFFDEHLNEVVYLFENSQADVIVFEDLDRYNNPDVFRKLRELNQLINKRFLENLIEQESKKKLIFLYLIKDDIFVSKDRAKFFDLIIPIVPVVTSSNSYNKILLIFEEEIIEKNSKQAKDRLSKSFLRKLSLYLDDMRLITNIYNEYKIYNATINTANLSADKLLAIITYKNIFPRDFSNLQYGKGFLYTLINEKGSLLSIQKSEISSDIQILKDRIENLEKEKITSILELQMIYLKTDNIFVDNKSEADFGSRSVYIQEILKGKSLLKRVFTRDNYNRIAEKMEPITIDEILEHLNFDEEYQNRKEIIEEKNTGELENLRNSIEKLKLEIKQGEVTSISELYEQNIFQEKLNSKEYKEIKNNEYSDLLKFLIKEKFIDETFNNYMNYFYDNDLRKEDTIFLRELYEGQSMTPNYKLSSLESIIEILEEKDYSRKGILNNNIFEYLLNNNSSEKMKDMIFVASQEKNIKFILDLYNYLTSNHTLEDNKKVELWIKSLASAWIEFYSDMINHLKSEELEDITSQKRLIFDALCYLDVEQINAQNQDKQLGLYLNKNIDILNYLNKDNWNKAKIKLTQNLEKLNTEFLNFDRNTLYEEIVNTIIDKNFYKLNYQNIETIALFKSTISENVDPKSFKEQNLTYIMKSDIEPLKSRISNNMNDYVELYLEFSKGVIYDSVTVMLQVLNDISVKNKVSYLEATKHEIGNIEDVLDQSLWSTLLKKESVKLNISNIVRYYLISNKKWEPELVEFVNQSKENIESDFEKVIEDFGEIGFFGKTVKLNELNDNHYRDMIGKSGYKIEDHKIVPTTLDNTKIQILIDYSVLTMSSGSLNYIRKSYTELSAYFAVHYFEEYVDIIRSNFNEKEIIDIFNSSIGTAKKEELLSKIDTTKKISIANLDLTSSILFDIIEQHLKDTEIPILFLRYSEFSLMVQEKIIEVAKKNIELMKSKECDKKLVIEILKSNLDVKIKQQLFKTKVSMMNYEDILSLISMIDLSKDYKELKEGRWPKFQKTEINIAVINRLEEIGVISSQSLEDGRIIARGKKNNKGRSTL